MAKIKLCLCGCGEPINAVQYLRFKWVDYEHKKHWLLTSEKGQLQKVMEDRKKLNTKKIKPLSKKRSKQNNLYLKANLLYLDTHPECEYKYDGCMFKSTEIDHTKGRIEKLLNDIKYFKATCRNCHNLRHKKNL